MDDVKLTLYCARVDRDVIADAVMAEAKVPLHVREESVRGRDYSDADTAEQVIGALGRNVIDLTLQREQAEAVVRVVAGCRRRMPVRWLMTPILAEGRLP